MARKCSQKLVTSKFGVEDVTVKTPVGVPQAASLSRATTRSHPAPAITEGRLAFEVPVMNQNVKFDGSYNTKGLYRIKAGAAGSIGGFTYTGEVYAANQYGKGWSSGRRSTRTVSSSSIRTRSP